MPIRTVEELVRHLKARGVKFYVEPGGAVRTMHCETLWCEDACPIVAAAAPDDDGLVPDNDEAWDIGTELGLPYALVNAVINAADNGKDHDPAIRAALLTLVQ